MLSSSDGLGASVWLPDESAGLSMSRSIGDKAFHKVGVTAEADVVEYELGHFDEVLVIATDGIWEMMSSEEAISLVGGYKHATEACVALIQEANKKWREAEGSYRDDVTAIVVYLRGLRSECVAAKDPGNNGAEGKDEAVATGETTESNIAQPGIVKEDAAEKADGVGGVSPPPRGTWLRRRSLVGDIAALNLSPNRAPGRRNSFTMAPDMDQSLEALSPGSPKHSAAKPAA